MDDYAELIREQYPDIAGQPKAKQFQPDTDHFTGSVRTREIEPTDELNERFDRKWVADLVTGCWEWLGCKNGQGYGNFRAGRSGMRAAHRYSYTRHRGPIPPGLVLDHLCQNPGCVNPHHLEAVTAGENQRRSRASTAANPEFDGDRWSENRGLAGISGP